MLKKYSVNSMHVAMLMFLIYIISSSSVIAGSGAGSQDEGPYDDCSAFEDSAYKECIFELNRAYNNYNANNNNSGSNDDPHCVVYSYPGGYYSQCF